MNKKASKIVLVAAFLAMLYVPTLAGFIAGDKAISANLENRVLAQFPELSFKNLGALPAELEAYYSDNQPFRDQLIHARAKLSKALYDRDISRQVVFGKDDWLFYAKVSDGAPISSYRGEDLFTGVELRQIASGLTRVRDDLKKIGCDFVLFIPPNKERIYSEYMPDRFGEPGESYAVKQLIAFLKQRTNLRVVYPYDDLMAAKQAFPDIPLYYSKDTHWNDVGSYIGTRALMRELGVELPELTRDMISKTGDKGPMDLAILAHLSDDFELDDKYAVTFDPQKVVINGAEDRVLYMRHDSFGLYMSDYMKPWFSAEGTTFSQTRSDESVDSLKPDVFVVEVLERFVPRNLWKDTLYEAPESRTLPEADG